MQNRELSRQLQSINNLFGKTTSACDGDIELQSHWAKYLCIITAGFIENSLKEIYSEFVKGAASPPVANYAIGTLAKIQNPNAAKFIQTVESFKEIWKDELKDFMDEKGRKEAIDSIMSNRHLIAHGKSSGITVARLRDYMDRAIEVIEFLEKQVS